jgi:molybdopterin synthase catalytic subunit
MAFLTAAPIEPAAVLGAVQSPSHGGTALFVGTVRDSHRGRAVRRLEYRAYPEMAEREARAIVAEASARWPVAVAAQHRTGSLALGEVAIAVAAASAHRESAFLACRWVVDELKRRVPIWKRECYADGSADWIDPSADAVGSA